MQRIRWGSPPVGLFNFPLNLWQRRGALHKASIELQPTSHLTGEEYGAQIRAGAYDMGQIGTPVFLPAAQGRDEYAVISAGICDYAPFYLVAAPGVQTLAQCRGESVVINKRMTCPDSLLEWHARQVGLEPDALHVVELMRSASGDNYGLVFLDAVGRGGFRAGILYEPYVSTLERIHGWRVLADYAALLRPANYGVLLYARRAWIEHQPELVRTMLAEYFSAARHARAHPAQLRDFAQALPTVSADDLERAVQRDSPHWRTEPSLDAGFMQRVEQELRRQGRVAPEFNITDHLHALF